MVFILLKKTVRKYNKMDKKELLELRKRIKSNKPTFIRSSAKIKARVSNIWRKPKGLQNKMRLNKKGYHRVVRHGYGSPTEVKDLDQKTGLYPVVIANKKDLEKIDTKTQAALISSTVGVRKKLDLIKFAEEKNIIILQDIKKVKASIDKILDVKKKVKKKLIERKQAKEKKQKKAQQEKKEKEDKKNKEKKEAQVKEQQASTHDNVVTKKAEEADKANKEILQKRV